ncbi:MAG: threonine ammonia-lyase [Micavibrio sp.]|nr:threonine ammonia-lyase [Micavibrio sp.]|tara:strand:- start:3328 stop:4539 length:1212 start_codon:yes stop_codon:yes gene_type:complete
MALTFKKIEQAYDAIKDSTIRTPVVKATRLSLHLGIDLYLKLENLQHTNAFKARGALNKLLSLTDEQRKAGVIACSAGNHAQGVAYHATRLGVPSTIVMPNGTPFNKIQRTEDFGAKVVLHGSNFDESVQFTMDMAKEKGFTFIHPFDDEFVAAGQGTLGLELMEQKPDIDAVIVPIGGGGLIAGVAMAVKGVKPEIEVIGAQAEMYDAVKAAQEHRAGPTGGATLAEGIAVKAPSKANMKIIDKYVDWIDSASEAEIEGAVFDLLSAEKLVVEGAPGAGLAVLKKNLKKFKGKKVCLIVCGGNIDSRLLSTLILRGLVRDGRITRLVFEIDDTPGQLSDIARLIGESGANVVEVIHQRMMQSVSLKKAELEVVIEARDKYHVKDIIKTLKDKGFKVRANIEV